MFPADEDGSAGDARDHGPPRPRLTRVHLVPLAARRDGFDHEREDFKILVEATQGARDVCQIVEEPDAADVVIFVGARDAYLRDIRRSAIYRRHRARSFVYYSGDVVVPYLPGVYPSIEQSHMRPRWTRSGSYLRWCDSAAISFRGPSTDAPHLFSFVGAGVTHSVREVVLGLSHPRSWIEDSTHSPGRAFGQTQEVYREYRSRYGTSLAQSKFVLCPRGAGPSSMRIFEAMKAGRVPVVISDGWVPPDGPRWDQCSLRVKESEIQGLPRLLESLEEQAPQMGLCARQEWERYFAPDTCFRTLVHSILELARLRPRVEAAEILRARVRHTEVWLWNRYWGAIARIRAFGKRCLPR